jgi:hypothetical protein
MGSLKGLQIRGFALFDPSPLTPATVFTSGERGESNYCISQGISCDLHLRGLGYTPPPPPYHARVG